MIPWPIIRTLLHTLPNPPASFSLQPTYLAKSIHHYMDSTHFSAYFTLVSKELNTDGEKHNQAGCVAVNLWTQTSRSSQHCPLFPGFPQLLSQRAIHTSYLANLFLVTLSWLFPVEMIRKELSIFAGGPAVNSPPANAGHKDLIPGSGRAHVPQLFYWAWALESVLYNQRKPSCINKDQMQPKINKNFLKVQLSFSVVE